MPPRLSRPKVKQVTLYRWAHILLPLALLAGIIAVRKYRPLHGWVELQQLRSWDTFVNWKPRPYEDAGVRIVDIDEDSMAHLGQWPWPRRTLGRIVTRLADAGAAVVAFDAVFPEHDRMGPSNDAAFAAAIRKTGRVVLGTALRAEPSESFPVTKAAFGDRGEVAGYALAYDGATVEIPELEAAAAGIGSITTAYDRDGIVRRVPLVQVIRPPARKGQPPPDPIKVPSLAAEALRVAQGARTYAVKGSMPSLKNGMTAQQLDSEVAQGIPSFLKYAANVDADHSEDFGLAKIKIGQFIIPTDNHGRVYLYPTLDAPQRVIPAWKVLDRSFDPTSVRGCLVFIGTSAEGLKDLRSTALNAAVPGVTVHANIAEQAILGKFLTRPWWANAVELWTMAFFGVLITLVLSRFGAAWCLPIALLALGVSFGGPWYAFRSRGLLVDPFFPSVVVVAIYMSSSIVSYLKSELERRQVKGAFSRYMSPALVEQLAKHPEKLKLGGETREMTWHFCDIRGFTTISEQFDPHGLVQFINRFLTPMTEIILEHQGVIDKYMGDCIMAFWNAPLDDPEHARHACRAALDMHAALAELNAQWEAEAKAENRKFVPIRIGTGLNTGSCVVGNMGSDQRFDYSVLGDEVNLASRLEGQSKTYGVNIVIGPNTRAKAPDFAALELDLIKVKGKTVPVRIYALLGDAELATDAAFKEHAQTHERMIQAYRSKRFDEARELLERCKKTDLPLKKLYELYEHRLDAFAAAAPPADWDGTFTATTK